MEYTFKGNFGTLELIVESDGKATGTYQKGGVLSGTLTEGNFEGEWQNQGMEGLIVFTITEGNLNGKWKKGKEAGAMRGKWFGEQIGGGPKTEAEDQSGRAEEAPAEAEGPKLPTGWGTAHAISALIRHLMLADGQVDQEEISWMHTAIEHYNEVGIGVGDVWDGVDDEMQIYEKVGLHGKVLGQCVVHLTETLDFEQKSTLVNFLTQVVAQDGVINYEEYVAIRFVVEQFFPGQLDVFIDNMKNSGINVEDGS